MLMSDEPDFLDCIVALARAQSRLVVQKVRNTGREIMMFILARGTVGIIATSDGPRPSSTARS